MPTIRTRAAKGSALTHNEVDANFSRTVTQKTTAYTCTAADNRSIIEGNHATVAFTITLPTVATAAAAEPGDYRVTITNINAAVVSVDGNGVETINGSTDTITLKQWDSVTCVLNSAGTAWVAIQRTGDLGDVDVTVLNVTGAFTSLGIDDNATGEMIQISDGSVLLGDASAAESVDLGMRTTTDGLFAVVGGPNAASGSAVLLYGTSHSTNAGDMLLRSDGNTFFSWDESAGSLTISTGVGSKTAALTVDSIQTATFEGNVYCGAGKTTSPASLLIGDATLTTGTASIELGNQRNGDGAAFVDFHSEAVTYTDYALRIIRDSGANGVGEIIHRGTGSFSIITDEAANIVFQTNSTIAGTFDTSQNLDVVGDVTAATVNADGDTAAGDNAAMGYTATEGLILTGQGSTNDITLKNDADGDVLTVPTGTTTVEIPGTLAVEAYSEDADQYTATTGTRDLDVSLATYFYPSADLGTASITFTFSNPAASGRVSSFTLELLGADGATLTWPASVAWSNSGTEPTWTAGTDIVTFTTRDGGTTWRGALFGLNF